MSQNGTISTGPRTEAGKAISSKNALSHGLTASCLVLPWENKADFDGMLDALVAEHQPATITEQIMVKEMAENYWRLMRARNQEHGLLCKAPKPQTDPTAYLDWEKCVALSQRYATRFERAFHKCLSTLRTLQKERRTREAEAQAEAESKKAAPKVTPDQFVSQKAATAAAPDQFVSQKAATAAAPDQFVSQNALSPVPPVQSQAA